MACYHPITAWRTTAGSILFAERGDIAAQLTFPCGGCIGCRQDKARNWTLRAIHEAKTHKHNCFITLTFNDENNPHTISKRDWQLFAKRLRKKMGQFRYFACGEYGDQDKRPHYHALVFGLDFPDKKPLSRKAKSPLWTSKLLEETWGMGYVTIGQVTAQTAAYCTRYVLKKITGARQADHYKLTLETGEVIQCTPEFAVMSRRPGLGAEFYEKFTSDMYPNGQALLNYKPTKTPRYYDDKYKKTNPDEYEKMKQNRIEKTRKIDRQEKERTRLEIKEQVHQAKTNFFKKGTL